KTCFGTNLVKALGRDIGAEPPRARELTLHLVETAESPRRQLLDDLAPQGHRPVIDVVGALADGGPRGLVLLVALDPKLAPLVHAKDRIARIPAALVPMNRHHSVRVVMLTKECERSAIVEGQIAVAVRNEKARLEQIDGFPQCSSR